MSEAGMALSNPYRPVEERSVGCVGLPLPGISARIAIKNDDGQMEPLVTVESDVPETRVRSLTYYHQHYEFEKICFSESKIPKSSNTVSIMIERVKKLGSVAT